MQVHFFRFFLVTTLLSFSSLAPAQSTCDLEITGSSISDNGLALNIHSSMANLNPYKVTLSQNSQVVGSWSSVPHKAGDALKISGYTANGIVTVRVQSEKKEKCYAEKALTLTRVEAALDGKCDLIIKSFSENGSSLLLDLYSPHAGLAPYDVVVTQGKNELGNWKKVPHASGELLKVDGVNGQGEYLVRVTSTTRAGCSADYGMVLQSQKPSEGLKCKQGPTIRNISNISNTGLMAQFHGEDVFGIDFSIVNPSGKVEASGALKPQNNTPSLVFPYLAKGDYKLIFKANTCVGESSKAFAIATGVEQSGTSGGAGGALEACKVGPQILNISNISSSGLSAQFNGQDVFGLDYKILNSLGAAVVSSSVIPKSPIVDLPFSSLAPGEYTLVLSGNTCVGESTKTFSIPRVTIPDIKDPVVVTIPNCQQGPEITDINSVTSTGLVVQFQETNLSVVEAVINDSNGVKISSSTLRPKNSSSTLAYDSLKPGSYTLILTGVSCKGSSSKSFTLEPPVVVTPPAGGTSGSSNGITSCKRGPTITSISNITKTSLKAQFDGEGVESMSYDILDNAGKILLSDSFLPTSSAPIISYPEIAAGDYTLVFRGLSCEGVSSKAFSVKGVEVVVDPVPADDAALSVSARFGEVEMVSESNLEEKGGTYATKNNYQGVSKELLYSFVAPPNDSMKFRPFVLMVHEGAFLFGDLGAEIGKARGLATKGYAAAAINYRLGFGNASETNACGGNSKEVIRAIYRAVQDTRSALKYFSDRASEFGIDKNQIFLGGSSAGSMTVAALAYMTEADFEALDSSIVKELGPLAEGSHNYRVRGLLTRTGYSVLGTQYVTASNALPTVFFQSAQDTVLPYNSGRLYYCGDHYPTVYGAKAASDRLKGLKVAYELNFDPAAKHLLDFSQDHIVNHYANFIKRLWAGDKRQMTYSNSELIEEIRN